MFSFRKILALIFTVSISIVCAIEISLSVNDVEELSNETQMLLLTAVTIDYALYRLLVSFTRHPDPQRPGHNQCAATIWSGRILTLEECIKLYWDLVEFKPVLPQQRNAQLEDFTSFKALEISRGEIQNCIIPFDLILRNTHLWNLISHNRLLYQPSGPIAFHHLSERDLNLLQKNFIRHFVFENPSICGCLTTAAICSLSFIDSEGCRASVSLTKPLSILTTLMRKVRSVAFSGVNI